MEKCPNRKRSSLNFSIFPSLPLVGGVEKCAKWGQSVFFLLFTQGDVLFETCKTLGEKLNGKCFVTVEIQGKQLTANVKIDGEENEPYLRQRNFIRFYVHICFYI